MNSVMLTNDGAREIASPGEEESLIRIAYQLMINRGITRKRELRIDKNNVTEFGYTILEVDLDKIGYSLSQHSKSLIESIARDGRSVNIMLGLKITIF